MTARPHPDAGVAADAPTRPSPRRSGVRLAVKILASIVVGTVLLLTLAGGGLYFMMSQGPVSNDQLRSRLEGQLDGLLGDGLSVRLGETSIGFGNAGLLSLDMRNAVLLQDGRINLGVAEKLSVSVSAMPLLQGQVVAEGLKLQSAQISVAPLVDGLSAASSDMAGAGWPETIDFAAWLDALGGQILAIAGQLERAGLQSLAIEDANLVGFDAFGLRSRTARILEMSFERGSDREDRQHISGIVETEHNTLTLSGSLASGDAPGRRVLELKIDGLDMRDVLDRALQHEASYLAMDSPIGLSVTADLEPGGRIDDATARLDVGNGRLEIGKDFRSSLSGAQLNFRYIRKLNQIELDPSPLRFAHTQTVLAGGVRFPRSEEEEDGNPLFELLANDIEAYGMNAQLPPGRGAMKISGHLDNARQRIVADSLLLQTSRGGLSGSGFFALQKGEDDLQLDLKIDRMAVDQFKQFWPSLLASGAHKWARSGISGGEVRDAWFRARTTAERLWGEARLTADEIAAEIPVVDAVVETVGDIPEIRSTDGMIEYGGMRTTIHLREGQVTTDKAGVIAVSRGKLAFGDYDRKPIPARLELSLDGS